MAADNPKPPSEETSAQPTTTFGPFVTYTPRVMASSSTTPRRSTITGFRALPTPPQPAALPLPVTTRDGACTHMSVTRLYTTEFSCQICGEIGPMGWIFRCIQDRENMIEHDLGAGVYDKIDDLCDVLETSNNPKKRSPAARESPLSLLDEMTEAQLATYTPAQIAILLKQRANLQEVLATTNVLHAQTHASQAIHHLQQQFGLTPAPNGTPPSNTTFQFLPTPSVLKPWVPLKECQFKACARCRPSWREKSYLRLDSILNNDIPATASMGFGFHLIGERPVALAEIVKNLGLRPNPEPTDYMSTYSTYSSDDESEASFSRPEELTMAQLPLSLRRRLATLNLYGAGLGIDSDGNDITNSVPRPATPTNIIFSADEAAAAAASSSFNPSHLKENVKQAENKAENWYTHSNNSISNLSNHNSTPPKQNRSPQAYTFALPSSPSFSILNQAERGQEPRPKPRKLIRKLTGYPEVEKQIQMPKIMVTNENNVEGDVDVDTSDTAYDSEEDSGEENESLRRTREVFRRERSSSLPVVVVAEDNRKDIVEQKVEENEAVEDVSKEDGLKEDISKEKDDKKETVKSDLKDQKDEAEGNTFPSTPVILKDGGIAVTEEAVEKGVADVVLR